MSIRLTRNTCRGQSAVPQAIRCTTAPTWKLARSSHWENTMNIMLFESSFNYIIFSLCTNHISLHASIAHMTWASCMQLHPCFDIHSSMHRFCLSAGFTDLIHGCIFEAQTWDTRYRNTWENKSLDGFGCVVPAHNTLQRCMCACVCAHMWFLFVSILTVALI